MKNEREHHMSKDSRHSLRNILVIMLFAVMLICVSACGDSGNAGGLGNEEDDTDGRGLTKITFCLEWTPNTNHTGIYAAKALGYYEDAGLDVSIVQPPENGAALMCAAGQAQFAVEGQDTMAALIDSDEPPGITAVCAIVQHNTSGIMSRTGDGISTPKGLEGKTYSTWQSPIELAMIKKVMEDYGADFDRVKLIDNNITDEPAALAAGQTDAVWVFYGWGGIRAETGNVNCDFWYFNDLEKAFDYYTPVIIANNEFLEECPDIAGAFLDATKKGYEYAVSNPREAADILIDGDDTGSLRDSKEFVYASQEYLSKEYISDAPSFGVIDSERWNLFYEFLYDNGLTVRNLSGKGYSDKYM